MWGTFRSTPEERSGGSGGRGGYGDRGTPARDGAWVKLELDQDASQPKWESVGIRNEESVGVVQEVMQREGIATALEGCSDTKPGWPSIGPLELAVLR